MNSNNKVGIVIPKKKSAGTTDSDVEGVVTPLVGLVSLKTNSLDIESAYASCGTYTVEFFKVNSNGVKASSSSAKTTLDSSARYKFKKELFEEVSDTGLTGIIIVKGCDRYFSRPVTGLDSSQDIDEGSTFVQLALEHDAATAISMNLTQLNSLLEITKGKSFSTLFSGIYSGALKSRFVTVFGSTNVVDSIKNGLPQYIDIELPTNNLNELQLYTLEVSTSHIDPNYTTQVEWSVNGIFQSAGTSFNYTPGKNAQGLVTIGIKVGKDNAGSVDLTKAYQSYTYTLGVNNTFSAIAPTITNNSGYNYVNGAALSIDIDTGVAQANCATFSDLAIKINDPTTPVSGDFTYSCSTAPTQTEGGLTVNTGQSTNTVYIWARDAEGNISSSQSLVLTTDMDAPTGTVAPYQNPAKGNSTQEVQFSLSDNGGIGLASANLYYASDGTTYGLVGALNVNDATASWAIPADNVGTAKIKITAVDTLGNSADIESSAFTVDSIAPAAPSIALASASVSNSTSITATMANCTDTDSILMTEAAGTPTGSEGTWQSCGTGAGAMTYTLTNSTNEGKTIHVWAQDAAGNISASATDLNMIFDNTDPVVSITAPAGGAIFNAGTSTSITWTATDTNISGTPIAISYSSDNGTTWTSVTAATANDGTENWTTPNTDSSQFLIRIIATDEAGNTGTATMGSNFGVDYASPVLSSFTITGAPVNTNNFNLTLDFSATDSVSNIEEVCFKWTAAATHADPTAGDSCWVPVAHPSIGLTAAKSISFTNYPFQIGMSAGNYNLFAWAKDAQDRVSAMGSAGSGVHGVDRDTVNLDPGTPATIVNLVAIDNDRTDLSAIPDAEKIVAASNTVYIKWKLTDDFAIPASAITLFYTTDDTNWTQITAHGGPNYDDSATNSCTLDGGTHLSGCLKWDNASPTSSYFRVKLVVVDGFGYTTTGTSNPVNVSSEFTNLAGNSDHGLDGSAQSAIFFPYTPLATSSDKDALAVDSKGVVYVNDYYRGVLKIDPADGKLTRLIPTNSGNGEGFGDGGPYTSATLMKPTSITVDYEDNLYIWDSTRIRKVNFTTGKIHTIIGGGADATASVTAAWDVSLCDARSSTVYSQAYKQMTALPNGKMIFTRGCYAASSALPIYHYTPAASDASEGSIVAYTLTGTGTATSGAHSIPGCLNLGFGHEFDLSTSTINYIWGNVYCSGYTRTLFDSSYSVSNTNAAITGLNYVNEVSYANPVESGLDGKIYAYNRTYGTLNRYDGASNSWQKVLGVYYQRGTCADSTAATSCNTDIYDVFVNRDGKVYFWDRMGIRTIDSSGNVQTLYGQSLGYGDGGPATSARFNLVRSFDYWNDGADKKVVVMDHSELVMREFTVGGNINRLAGNGKSGTTYATVDPLIEEMFTNHSGSNWPEIAVNTSTGQVFFHSGEKRLYFDRLGSGVADVWTLAVTSPWVYPGRTMAYADGTNDMYLRAESTYSGGQANAQLAVYEYDGTSWTHNVIAGTSGVTTATDLCDATEANNCMLPQTYSEGYYLGGSFDGTHWYLSKYLGTELKKFPHIGGTSIAGAVELTTSFPMIAFDYDKTSKYLYYCNSSGNLRLVDNSNPASPVEFAIAMPISSMKCAGRKLRYDPLNDSIIFIYDYNYMMGIGRINNASSYRIP